MTGRAIARDGVIDVQPMVEALLHEVASKGLPLDLTLGGFVAMVDAEATRIRSGELEAAAVFWRAWSEAMRRRHAEVYLAQKGLLYEPH